MWFRGPVRLSDGTLYFDANATTPEAPAVTEAVAQAARLAFANPSSPHGPGRVARAALEKARGSVASLCGCLPSEVVFCGSATEANFLALRSAVAERRGRNRILASGIEHPSVLAALEGLKAEGWEVELLPITPQGSLDLPAFEHALDSTVAAVSLMAAHNETGVVQPIREVAGRCREHGALFHTDAVQLLGKLPSPWADASPDYMTLAGHKLYGPKGIAALCVREGHPVSPLLSGGGQEAGRRASTEAVPLAVGLGVASDLAAEALLHGAATAALRDALEQKALLPLGAQVHGAGVPRLPNTSYFTIPGASGDAISRALDELGIAVGTGSACHAGSQELPRVLQWMGIEAAEGVLPVRISLSRATSPDEVETLSGALRQVVGDLRGRF